MNTAKLLNIILLHQKAHSIEMKAKLCMIIDSHRPLASSYQSDEAFRQNVDLDL